MTTSIQPLLDDDSQVATTSTPCRASDAQQRAHGRSKHADQTLGFGLDGLNDQVAYEAATVRRTSSPGQFLRHAPDQPRARWNLAATHSRVCG